MQCEAKTTGQRQSYLCTGTADKAQIDPGTFLLAKVCEPCAAHREAGCPDFMEMNLPAEPSAMRALIASRRAA